eukprot:TRINITY_DN2813_c0_g1_i2.p1 TRINITY_DN2813_c0_g1~~TRINITY_DN2813_c0_g1_i2.p1  ORF type:complete len:498 (+),score=156.55 TRINITY_DN2813_c0_g1_i2:105-1496(+)
MGRPNQILFAFFCIFFAEAFCQSSLRFLHAVPGAPTAIEVTFGDVVLGSDIAFGHATDYVAANPSTSELVVDLGSGTLLKYNLTLAANQKLTVSAAAAGAAPSFFVFTDATSGPASFSSANLRFINLVFNSSIALEVAGGANFNTQTFSRSSSYVSFAGSKNYTTTLVLGGKRFDSNEILEASEVYTAYAIGSTTAPQLLLLLDGNFRRSYIRFGHTSPDTGAVDIYVGSDKVFSNVTYPQTSPYTQLKDKDVIIKIQPAGKDTIILRYSLNDVQPGSIWAFFVAGFAASPKSVVFPEPVVDTTSSASVRTLNLSPDSRSVTVSLGKFNETLKFTNVSQQARSFDAGNYTLKIETNKDKKRRVWVRVNGEFLEQIGGVDTTVALQTTSYLLLVLGKADNITYQLNQVPSTNPPSPPLPNEPESSGLSGLAVASIIAGSLLGAILFVGVTIYYIKTRRQYESIP